jgi:hypothetical protein
MHGEFENERTQSDDPRRYEAPAIEAREPLNDPLIGTVSGRMLT